MAGGPTPLRVRMLALSLGLAIAFVFVETTLRVVSSLGSTGVDPQALRRTVSVMPPPYAGHCGADAPNAPLGAILRPTDTPGLVFELKPSIDTCYYGARVRTNRDGQRAPIEYPRPKPEGTFRILLLGDSQTFGQGVEYEETFGHLIERALQSEHPDVRIEVINAGVDGYNLYQEIAYLAADGLSFEPDVIIVLFVGNDLDLPFFLYTPNDPLATDRLYLVDAMARLFRPLPPGDPRSAIVASGRFVPAKYAHMAGAVGYETALRRLAELTIDRGIPVFNFVDQAVAMYAFGGETRWHRTRDLADELGVVQPEFVFPRGFELSETNAHLNAEGHRILAETMLDALHAHRTADGSSLEFAPSTRPLDLDRRRGPHSGHGSSWRAFAMR